MSPRPEAPLTTGTTLASQGGDLPVARPRSPRARRRVDQWFTGSPPIGFAQHISAAQHYARCLTPCPVEGGGSS